MVLPAADKADVAQDDGRHVEALGHLLGILLFARYDDDWIRDQETYSTSWDDFSGFFDEFGEMWKILLEESDDVLGWAPDVGLEGGYREGVVRSIKCWQRDVNKLLVDFDEFAQDGYLARVAFCSDADIEALGPDDEDSGWDEDDDEDSG